MAATTIEELQVLITSETSGLRKELDKVRRDLSSTNASVNKSTSGMSKALKKLAPIIASVFAVKKIIDFGRASVQAASQLESALLGLQSILEAQGRSYNKANKFIQDYISDGLVPLTDAVTAYKNLTARGYNDDQIQQTLLRLKDAASFGRQANYTLGEAVKTATEGLKNENSILVDNAGVTKNVAKMWDEYARSIGKNAQQLTQQEKIQAEVNGIMKETQFQVGDAAKYADTYAGRMAKLNKTLTDIKVNLGTGLMAAINAVLPYVQALMDSLATATKYVSQFMQALFGKVEQPASAGDTLGAIGDSAETAGNQIAAAGKKAKKGLAGFDEINKLGVATSGAAGAASGASTGPDFSNIVIPDIDTETVPSKLEGMLDRIKRAYSKLAPSLQPAKSALQDLWNNTLVPMADFWLHDYISPISQGMLDTLVPIMADVVPWALEETGKHWQWLADKINNIWETIIRPVYEQIRDVVVDVLEIVSVLWETHGETLLNNLSGFMDSLRGIWDKLWTEILEPIIVPFLELLKDLWDNHLKDLVAQVGEFVMKLINGALELYNGFIAPLISWLIDLLAPGIQWAFSFVLDVIGTVVGTISDILKGIMKALGGIIDFIVGVFTGNWRRAWTGVKNIFIGIWDAVKGVVKGALNLVIDVINGVIKGLNKINFKIPKWVPGIGGKSFGINIPLIPKLADGGILSAGQLFIAREKGPELVGSAGGGRTGVMNNEQIVTAVSTGVYNAVVAAMGNNQNGNGAPVHVHVHLGYDTIFSGLAKENKRRVVRAGRQLAVEVG